ncbi:hypothetical protein CGRA01v4_10439 [Colletotrichum graminicola]|nr:hypothetical protein CGRA01v4_10439 [Colletotrichum graminicola]
MTSTAFTLRYSHLMLEPMPTPGLASTPSAVCATTPKVTESLLSNAMQSISALAYSTTDGAVEVRMSPLEMSPPSRRSPSPLLYCII